MPKLSLLLLLFLLAFGSARAQQAPAARPATPDPARPVQVVEAACGQCQFGMPGRACDLAVRLPDGQPYFVEGTTIDSHGDAHAADGFCQHVRRARVQGAVADGRFHVTYFELLPLEPKQ